MEFNSGFKGLINVLLYVNKQEFSASSWRSNEGYPFNRLNVITGVFCDVRSTLGRLRYGPLLTYILTHSECVSVALVIPLAILIPGTHFC